MEAITGYISDYPAILVIGVTLIIVLFLHFTIKSLLKLVLIMIIILFAVYGYYHFKDPESMTGKTTESKEIVQYLIDDVKSKSKTFFEDMKDIYRKGKNAPKEVDKLLDSSKEELDKEFQEK